MAPKIGRTDDHAKYIKRSRNWKNMYKDDQTSVVNGEETNYTGFLQPRYANGTWGYQNPSHCSPLLDPEQCYLNADGGETYEGSPWLYTFFAPHDMASLITTLGGPDRFVSRLDFFHDSGIAYIGDEQAFLPVFLYHYAGHPGLSTRRAHYYIPGFFNHSVGGLPGNDDSGAMGSFQVLTMMGLWPVSGQNVYLINAPFFREVNITNPVSGKTATIRNLNFDPDFKRIYIQSAELNGQEWTKSWIKHDFFEEGGVLELTLGDRESDWGTRQEDLPPSLSDGGSAITVGRSKIFF
ncbi:Nuclear control of ATPase protein 2 [Ascosphaera pollenicola]|nr:Nuclear control of ATPase protein 2 [Ascosphaera pollenicola]